MCLWHEVFLSVYSDLNMTLNTIRMAEVNKSCGEYDSIAVYEGLKSIMQTVGYDFCPGIMDGNNATCAEMNRMMMEDGDKEMMEDSDKEVKCEVEEVPMCVEEQEMLRSLVMMSETERMKAARMGRPRDHDQMCM